MRTRSLRHSAFLYIDCNGGLSCRLLYDGPALVACFAQDAPTLAVEHVETTRGVRLASLSAPSLGHCRSTVHGGDTAAVSKGRGCNGEVTGCRGLWHWQRRRCWWKRGEKRSGYAPLDINGNFETSDRLYDGPALVAVVAEDAPARAVEHVETTGSVILAPLSALCLGKCGPAVKGNDAAAVRQR